MQGFMQDKILLVDDDDMVLECFRRLLGRHFDIETAGPEDALDAMSSRGPYAVVVSDLLMPGLNGVQFLEKAKKLSPAVVGIVLSGSMEAADPRLSNNSAIYKVLDKPCPYPLLMAAVREAIVIHHQRLGTA